MCPPIRALFSSYPAALSRRSGAFRPLSQKERFAFSPPLAAQNNVPSADRAPSESFYRRRLVVQLVVCPSSGNGQPPGIIRNDRSSSERSKLSGTVEAVRYGRNWRNDRNRPVLSARRPLSGKRHRGCPRLPPKDDLRRYRRTSRRRRGNAQLSPRRVAYQS